MAQNLLRYDNQSRTHQKTDWFEVLPLELQSDATRTSGLFIAYHSLGVMFQILTDNEAGAAGTFTPKILVPSAVDGEDDIVIATFTAIDADGTNILVLYPVTLTDIGDEALIGTLPREWKLELTYSGTPNTDMLDTRVHARYI